MKDEWWRLKDEGWKMKVERWRMKDEWWRMKAEMGFALRTDICDCWVVAFEMESLSWTPAIRMKNIHKSLFEIKILKFKIKNIWPSEKY